MVWDRTVLRAMVSWGVGAGFTEGGGVVARCLPGSLGSSVLATGDSTVGVWAGVAATFGIAAFVNRSVVNLFVFSVATFGVKWCPGGGACVDVTSNSRGEEMDATSIEWTPGTRFTPVSDGAAVARDPRGTNATWIGCKGCTTDVGAATGTSVGTRGMALFIFFVLATPCWVTTRALATAIDTGGYLARVTDATINVATTMNAM